MSKKLMAGERVQMTSHGIRSGLNGKSGDGKHCYGTVMGISRDGLLRVQRDGIAEVERYSPVFWMRIPKKRTQKQPVTSESVVES